MQRARAKKANKRPRTTELSRLKRDLQRVSKQLKSRDRELAKALEQQTTSGEILRVIGSSPTNLQSVLNTVAENAARLCEANDGQLRLIEGNDLKLAASFGPIPVTVDIIDDINFLASLPVASTLTLDTVDDRTVSF